ncbi:MAG: SBBP repeat-containing protein, partial [Bacteroidales bacterium]
MKKLILFIAFIRLVSCTNAQTSDWLWAKSAGGTTNDEAENICTDALGNIYIAGEFESPFIIFGMDTLYNNDTTGSTSDIFIAKYDANGNNLWAKSAGGIYYEQNEAIAIDKYNNVYITGYFYSKSIIFDNDTLHNVDTTTTYTSKIYFVKLNPNGNVIWAKCLGDTDYNNSCSLALDKENNIYMSGGYCSQRFYFGNDTLNNMGAGYTDIFLLKFDPSGNPLWAKSFGSNNEDWGRSIITDSTGNIYMTGNFSGLKFIAGSDTLYQADPSWDYQTSSLFIMKMDTLGNMIWAKCADGDEGAYPVSIALDKNNNIYVTGSFYSDTLILGKDTLLNAEHSYSNEPDVFTAKYDKNGNEKWAKQAGGVKMDEGNSLIIDGNNYIFIVGDFVSSFILFGHDTLFNYDTLGGDDFYIVKYDTSGNVIWAKSAGGNRNDNITCITEDN